MSIACSISIFLAASGRYDASFKLAKRNIKLTDDVCVLRLIHQGDESAQEDSFRDSVRARDGSASINSIQNGILLSASMHRLFDIYFVGVNPDDNYKITHFSYDNWSVDNRVLEDVCRKEGSPDRVADELLRWHFRQCVLANMKGDGEPVFEHDLGTDMIGEILRGPYPAERMEMELYSRLRGLQDKPS
ncbi:hypothetical protein N7519_009275 [Penicillium mononematosum]|uniref:uncharacterized protein n=1 Tax=Penicillium mononematosum TaxID=268346 RepID=UPI002547F6BA|nr:uncharacterized protein N7519_009275 [Penicillium mononematosum]KAJ6178814.1 hypothetical protein N7519_009275 [Penicillium mononematosum]